MRRALGFGLFVAVAVVTLAFLALPIVGIFAHTSPGKIIDQLSNPGRHRRAHRHPEDERGRAGGDPRSSARRPRICSPPAASRATRSRSRSSSCRSCCRRPSRASACSPRSAASACSARRLRTFGIELPFTQAAVTVAVAYVASPLYIRQAIAVFEATDPHLTAASRTLGAGPVRTFFRVVLPLARGGLIAGLALSFARGLGEFGATIMFAGSLQKVTQTLPLAIYQEFDVELQRRRLAMSAVLVLISAVLLLTLRIALSWRTLTLDQVTVPLRAFRARAEPRGRLDLRARRPVRERARAPSSTRSPASSSRPPAGSAATTRPGSTPSGGVFLPPGGPPASGSSSRTTRSSRT